MKKVFVLLLIWVMVIALASFATCAKPVKIGVSNCSDTDTFTKLVADTLKEMIQKGHPEWNVSFVGAEMDSNIQISQVQAFIANGCNYICMSSADTAGSSPCLDDCLKAGVPLINYVNPIKGDQSKYTYIGGNNPTVGRQIADYAAKVIPKNGTCVILEGDPGAQNGVLRVQGCKTELAKVRPDVKILASQTANWDVEKAMSLMEDWLTKYGDKGINAVLAMNDNMALGAVEALKAHGLAGKVIVTGCDGTKDAWEAIKAGNMTMSMFYNHVAQATGVYKTLEKLIKTGKSATDWIYTPFETVDKTNVDKYLSKYYGS